MPLGNVMIIDVELCAVRLGEVMICDEVMHCVVLCHVMLRFDVR